MSTQETPEQPHRRGRRLVVGSVAAAVLLAGGGGAYWASTASDGGGTDKGGRAGPPPLALDELGQRRTDRSDGGERGIAPGEPDPGGGPVYRADGRLPKGPESAAVHNPADSVGRKEVAALAKALDVPGTPVRQDLRWRVGGSGDGSGPSVTVGGSHDAGSWSYLRHVPSGDDRCGGKRPEDGAHRLPAPCPGTPDSGDPVTAERAREAVRPLLASLDLRDAALDASATAGALRIVTASPRWTACPRTTGPAPSRSVRTASWYGRTASWARSRRAPSTR